MINRRIHEIQLQENHAHEEPPLKIIIEARRAPKLRNYTPLMWEPATVAAVVEAKEEKKNNVEIKNKGKCVIL